MYHTFASEMKMCTPIWLRYVGAAIRRFITIIGVNEGVTKYLAEVDTSKKENFRIFSKGGVFDVETTE